MHCSTINRVLGVLTISFSALVFANGGGAPAAHGPATAAVPPDKAISQLKAGNQNYITGKAIHPNQDGERRMETVKGQNPFAIILGCSDSRVPPELIFDQGIGDLFIIRTAGNTIDDIALGSIEYGAVHLGVSLIVVLGHSSCGAVAATLKGGEPEGHVASIVKQIEPAVETAKGRYGDPLENAVLENIKNIVEKITESKPILAKLISQGKLKVVGARYSIDSGVVTFFE